MPAYKDKVTGTWFVKFYSKDWTGERKQIKRRGFETKKDALDYERNFKVREEYNLDMTFDEFFKLYSEDMQNRLKRNTWLSKEHIVRTKILPYFKNLKMCEITAADILKWQNEIMKYRDENGVGYSETYSVVNVRFCPQSVRGFCPEVAGFNAGTYEVPAYVL